MHVHSFIHSINSASILSYIIICNVHTSILTENTESIVDSPHMKLIQSHSRKYHFTLTLTHIQHILNLFMNICICT